MTTHLRQRQIGPLCLAIVLALAPALAAEVPTTTPALNLPALDEAGRLETILARFDQAQASIRTLEADFDELKELALLVDPVEGHGRFYYATPHQAKWEYLQPEARVFLISDNTLVQYFPAEKVLERRDLRAANTNRLFKLFGMGQSSKDLEDFYVISLGDDAGAPPDTAGDATDGGGFGPPANTYELILTPRRRAVEKRVSRVRLWIGDQDFLPRAIKVEEADGDFTYWLFSNVRINNELAAGVFELDVPDDVTIHKGISLFESSEGSAP
ncbi:MAG: outer membrane lipoprotein carrier protein LolA [Acidobacteria bacterium]|nr:outer membrane lipoprotein carrier protein LolA [Acidobacteriota bacterium]